MVAGNGIEAVDVDIAHAGAAARAVDIVEDIAGTTPVLRMGTKPMLFYRSSCTGKIHNPGNLAVEFYPGGRTGARGQVALWGGHPDAPAGRYTYPREPLRAVPAAELPELTEQHRKDIIAALTADALVCEFGRVDERVPGDGWDHEGTSWLAQARAHWPDLASWLAGIHPGARHYCGTACVMLTLNMRLPAAHEDEVLEALEIAFLEAKPGARKEWISILRWARAQQQRTRSRGAEARRRLGLREVHHG